MGDLDQKRTILRNLHDAPAAGHPRIARTREIVTRHYWWPQMAKDIEDYVKGCAQCQQNKVNTQGVKVQYHPITTTAETLPFQTIALDFITKLPKSKGYDTILTITDQGCTKMALFIPCNEEVTAEQVAYQYLINVFNRFGLPTKIISDRDTRFTSKFIKDLCKRLGITQNISTAYHPRTDGQSERTNQWLEQYVRFWTNAKQTDSATYLPVAEFAHNSWYSETTRTSPFRSLMGYNPQATWEVSTSSIPQVNTRLEQMMEAQKLAYEAQKRTEESWKHPTRQPQRQYKEGDQVWLEGTNIRTSHPTAKLAPKRHGPFQITKVLGPVTYQLQLPAQWQIHPVFHVDLLTPYKETATYGSNYTRPPPDLIDGEEEYEVERIINSRQVGRGRQVQYLVKWKGYPDSDNQWVKWQDVANAPDLLAEYQQENSDAITHIRQGETDETTTPPSSLSVIKEFIVPTTILFPISHLLPHMSDKITIYRNVAATPYEDETTQHTCDTFCRRTHTQGEWRPSTPPSILPRKREHDFVPTQNWTNEPNPDTSKWDVGTPDYDFDMSRPPSPAIRRTATTDKADTAEE